jgi:hypothetical protein
MHPLLKRILLNSLVTASVLGLMGYGLTELARMWLVTQAPVRAQPGAPAPAPAGDDTAAALGPQVPLVMAGWGVAFVVVGEVVLWFVRGRKQYVAKSAPAPVPAGPDPAEVLLEQLLREAEAKQAAETARSSADPDTVRVPASNS